MAVIGLRGFVNVMKIIVLEQGALRTLLEYTGVVIANRYCRNAVNLAILNSCSTIAPTREIRDRAAVETGRVKHDAIEGPVTSAAGILANTGIRVRTIGKTEYRRARLNRLHNRWSP